MRLTAFGYKALAFQVLMIVSYFVSPYTNLLFLLLAFLCVLLALALPWTWRHLAGVSARMDDAPLQAAGEEGKTTVQIDCGNRLRFRIELAAYLDGKRQVLGRLPGGVGPNTLEATLPALRRGVHHLRGVFLESTHPFGLIRRRVPIAGPEKILVYAAPSPVGRDQGGSDSESLGNKLARSGDRGPSGLRDYRPGDAPRLVDWKATARRGKLIVREFETLGGEGTEVTFDRRCRAPELERALSQLVGLAQWCREGKRRLSVRSQDLIATFGEGHGAWEELLTWVARTGPLPADASPPPPTSPDSIVLPEASAGRDLEAVR